MIRIIVGSLLAATATFLMGWLFFATPIASQGYRTASPDVVASVHDALKALPESGTYTIPYGMTATDAAMAREGTAIVQINREGVDRMLDPQVFGLGFLHMLLSFLLIGLFLWTLRSALPTPVSRITPVLMLAAIAVVWTRLGQPIWFHTDWRNAIYLALTDFLSLAVGGVILAFFIPRARTRG